MIELRVTGATLEELTVNATRMVALLQKVAGAIETSTVPASASTDPVAAPPGAASAPPGAASAPPASKPANVDSGDLKLAQISTRLAAVISAAADRGWDKERRTKYARELLSRIDGAKKVADIDTDDKRSRFMALSELYLTEAAWDLPDDDIPF